MVIFTNIQEYVQQTQLYLENRIHCLPRTAVNGLACSMAYSFFVSVLVTKGNIVSGLVSASLAAVASTLYIVAETILWNVDEKVKSENGSSRLPPIIHKNYRSVFLLGSSLIGLYTASKFQTGLSLKITLIATLPLLYWNFSKENSNKVPVIGLITI